MSHQRHGLRHCWHQIIVLRLMRYEAPLLQLTPAEESAVETALKQFAYECLYQASLHGWKTYRDYQKRLEEFNSAGPKDLARSVYSSARMLLQKRKSMGYSLRPAAGVATHA